MERELQLSIKHNASTIGHSSSNTEYVLPSEAEDNPIFTVAEEKDLWCMTFGKVQEWQPSNTPLQSGINIIL